MSIECRGLQGVKENGEDWGKDKQGSRQKLAIDNAFKLLKTSYQGSKKSEVWERNLQ